MTGKRSAVQIRHRSHSEDVLNSIDAASINPIPVIYQSGYLTIKDYDPRFRTYTLGFPNEEVEEGFTKYLMPCYISGRDAQSSFRIDNFVMEFKLDGTAKQALAQIQDKNYTLPFEIEDRQIVRIGISFDSATRNIDQCLVE